MEACVLFDDESKCTKVIFAESSSGEKDVSCFHPTFVTKIDRFGGKNIHVCGGILLGIGISLSATAGSDVVQSGRPIFDDFFQHLWPYIGNNTANVVFQMVKRLWLIRIDQ
ncbi:hypothetical protein TNCV_5094341 [Trichonephila clavipes]|nr:hypothetical protein TNCV_5094341 [Trichonephila clavipes]